MNQNIAMDAGNGQKILHDPNGKQVGSWWPAESAAIGFDAVRNWDQAQQWCSNEAEARAFVQGIEGPAARAKRIAAEKAAAAQTAADMARFAERRTWLAQSAYYLHLRDVEQIERITGLSADNVLQVNKSLQTSRHGTVTIEDLIDACDRIVAAATGSERPVRIGDDLYRMV